MSTFQDRNNPDLSVGDTLSGFVIKKITPLSKLNNILYQLEHPQTGASLIHLSNDDDNNTFGVAFRTTPTDSTGVAHILEHTALCGSKLFPVRDPFFSMIKRSLKTFMNAFTAPDWTMYPFSTQNKTDFHNLMGIYLDAAFFPLLEDVNFKQEGHRLEFEKADDPSSPLVYKGVVFNEMKGAMSSQSQVMYRCMGNAIFPTLTYRHNSGGDPEKITDLTHEQLIEFHRTHYHPSNSYFYTYGDFPLKESLERIHNQVLSKFEKISVDTMVPREQQYESPKQKTYSYPLSEAEMDGKNTQIAIAWMTNGIEEPLETLSLQVINFILHGHSGAPLRKALLESRLGKSLSDVSGYEDDIRECFFSTGLQGVGDEDLEKVEKLIDETIQSVVDKGIHPDQIESAIHQMELETREISGGHYPYGLNLLFRFFASWVHGGDPVKAIDFDSTLEQLRKKLKEGKFLESQIKKYLIDNPHRVKVILRADPNLEKERTEKEKEKLEEIKGTLTDTQKTDIVSDAAAMKEHQEQEEDLSCLPTLKVSDIPKEIKYVDAYKKDQESGITWYDRPTNGIVYIKWIFKLDQVPEEDRIWFPLVSGLLSSVGADGMSYEELAEQISRYTGGISAGPGIEVPVDSTNPREHLTVDGKALIRNLPKLFELTNKIIGRWDFSDMDRINTLMSQRANSLINSIPQSGHTYASLSAQRGLNRLKSIQETYGGINQVRFMKNLVEKDQDALKSDLERISQVFKSILTAENLSVLVIGEKESFEEVESLIEGFVSTLKKDNPDVEKTPVEDNAEWQASYQYEAWKITSPVSYVVRSHKAPLYRSLDAPVALVFSNLLKACYLHGEIREKGGAYGGMSSYDSDNGIFTLMSYRDPHLSRTVDVFDKALDWLKSGKFTDQDIEEAILQTCSKLDTPASPAGKAVSEYVMARKGKTKVLRENFRNGILHCSREELIRVGSDILSSTPSLSVVAGEEQIERDQGNLSSPLEVLQL